MDDKKYFTILADHPYRNMLNEPETLEEAILTLCDTFGNAEGYIITTWDHANGLQNGFWNKLKWSALKLLLRRSA